MPSLLRILVAAIVLLGASPAHRGVIDDDSPRPAVRLDAPAAAPDYPTSPCDRIVAGAEGLSGPTPIQFRQIGSSVLGRPIWAEYWGPAEPERVIVMVSQVHGNECAPQRMVRAVRTTELRHVGIWLIPSLNPDGAAIGSRLNANGIDLNADGWARRQPETRALMAFSAQIHPDLTVHVHSPNGGTGWFGDSAATAAALTIAVETSRDCGAPMTFDVAGERTDPATWFLWQGLAASGASPSSLLIELHAIADSEVPDAFPRPPTQSLGTVDCESRRILDVLDR